ncbi:MAG: hypothetical protein OEV06_10920 [Anaerolineae bacterium]|nr:hypothetical protein [Anaerolineae bacterium]
MLAVKKNAVRLSVLAFASFVARTTLEFRYVFTEEMFPQDLGTMTAAMLFYTLIITAWLLAHLQVERGVRKGWTWILVFSALTLFEGVGTTFSFCPTPCQTAWPVAEILNWSQWILGGLAAYAALIQLRDSK